MSIQSENPKVKVTRRVERHGKRRRLRQWWSSLQFPPIFGRFTSWLYDWWFPFSERSRAHYGYGGAKRQNRVAWLWHQLTHLVRRGFVASAFRTAKARWDDWWYPPVTDKSYQHSYHGPVRHHRLARYWRRLKRRAGRSFLSRGYDAVANRFYQWYYPSSNEKPLHPHYAHHRRSRLQLAWSSAKRRMQSSWLGRKYGEMAGKFYDWYFPLTDDSGAARPQHHRISRPAQFLRRNVRRFRRTRMGGKIGWVLDEADNIIFQVRSYLGLFPGAASGAGSGAGRRG